MFEFRVFLNKNNWIHTFPKGIMVFIWFLNELEQISLYSSITIISISLNDFNCISHYLFYSILFICLQTLNWLHALRLKLIILFNTIYLFTLS